MTGWYKAHPSLSLLFLPAQKIVTFPFFPHRARTPKWVSGEQTGWGRRGVLQGPHAMPTYPTAQQLGAHSLSPRLPRLSSAPSQLACPPKMEPGCSQGRPLVPHIYVNSFGSHRCGSLIRCGRGYKWAEVGRSRTLLSQQSPVDRSREQRAAKAHGDKADAKPSAAAGRAQEVESCGGVKDTSLCHDDLQKEKPDTFDFPCPSRNVEKVIKRKKKKSKVWLKVWKVISKMLEENEKFRSRLLTCSQLNGEGNGMKQSSQNETFSLDREESIFGWV
ncbi:uncharacterized protein C5orf47 homolog isoform X2 [Cygnus olor]|uniref:uncharacterized protein C5orf47 homolog isoform X2 n=1 Tax=Cygnus olor TaxID=8869 RepID=UPI001ADE6C09|nr:uncharacterized protein C5orf47 homolog isoform X2 [Cygnus olor]